MTTSVPVMNLTNGNGKKCDDFTKIKGIGLVKQQWLRESLKVYTFRDLASLSVDLIESVLKIEWQTISRKEIKTWISQAQELAADQPSLKQFVKFSDTQAELVEELPIESIQFDELTITSETIQAEVVEELPIESIQFDELTITSETIQTEVVEELPIESIQFDELTIASETIQTEVVEELPIESIQFDELTITSETIQTEAVEEFPIESSQSSNPLVKSLDVATEGNTLPSVMNTEWRSFASFKVEFQSRPTERQIEEQQVTIYYLESEQVQSWSSLESDRLQQWMLEQIQISATNRMQQLPEAGSPAIPLVALEITQIRAFQPTQTNRPMIAHEGNRLFPGTISSEKPFALEIDFHLAGLNVAKITKTPITYSAQFYVRHRVTGVIKHLGDTEPSPLTEGQLSYTIILAGITLEIGVYRLQASVKLQGISATPGSFKVPLLQVI